VLASFGVALLLGACSGQDGAGECEFGQAACGGAPSPDLNLLTLLSEVEGVNNCQLSREPRLITDANDLFNEIDGGAPRYIDRGWVKSVFAFGLSDGLNVQAAIHDMGTDENATAFFSFSKGPSMVPIDSRSYAVLDASRTDAYFSLAHLGRYVYEVSTDAQSPASLALINAVTVGLLDRSLAGH
jgi:hypothetical protein